MAEEEESVIAEAIGIVEGEAKREGDRLARANSIIGSLVFAYSVTEEVATTALCRYGRMVEDQATVRGMTPEQFVSQYMTADDRDRWVALCVGYALHEHGGRIGG